MRRRRQDRRRQQLAPAERRGHHRGRRRLSPLDAPKATANLYPAVDDPKFAGSGRDPGYLTSKPGTRESLFYAAAPSLTVVTIPETGHDLALSTTAPLTDAVMLAWSAATIARLSAHHDGTAPDQ